MDKFEELKAEYQALAEFLAEKLPGQAAAEELLPYYMAASLRIWSGNDLYSPDYAAALSAVAGKEYSIEQVMTAMSCCGDEERVLLIPAFFKNLIGNDRGFHTENTAAFVEKLNSLLVATAMINGDFTTAEAAALSDIISGLLNAAKAAGLAVLNSPSYSAKITLPVEESYLQNDQLRQAAFERRKAQRKAAATPQATPEEKHESGAPITINVTLTTDASTQDKAPDGDAESPSVQHPEGGEEETIESLLAELDSLVGLGGVKQDVHSLMNFIQISRMRQARGMKVPTISYHLVFTGNPGAGKTTIARLIGKLYYHIGILPKGQLVETDRSALVAGYLGQTAIKTQKVIQQAMGGVLFIDEAYSLAGETDDSYGKEAIETILKAMEDHRDELVVIVAGYTELMHKFIDSNPGLSSRFSKYFEFPDYSGEELLAIFQRFCRNNGYALKEDAVWALKQRFDLMYEGRDEKFGNARAARNIFEKAINAQADRLSRLSAISDHDLEYITLEDIAGAIGGGRG